MKLRIAIFLAGVFFASSHSLVAEEAAVIKQFEKAGARITKNRDGHAIKLFSGGKPPHSTAELQSIGKLVHLEELALNQPDAGDGDWEFLHELKHLKKLTIWHCKTIHSLEPFSNLAIESLTVGGSMGLRDLNKEAPDKHLNAVLTLTDLPNLRSINLYHTPLLPNDAHLAHLAKEFPKLEEVKIDLAAPRGFESTVTPNGIAELGVLPLKVLSLEHIDFFTPEHIQAIAKIESLEAVLIDCRKKPFDTKSLESLLKSLRSDLEIQVAGKDAKGPPRRS